MPCTFRLHQSFLLLCCAGNANAAARTVQTQPNASTEPLLAPRRAFPWPRERWLADQQQQNSSRSTPWLVLRTSQHSPAHGPVVWCFRVNLACVSRHCTVLWQTRLAFHNSAAGTQSEVRPAGGDVVLFGGMACASSLLWALEGGVASAAG